VCVSVSEVKCVTKIHFLALKGKTAICLCDTLHLPASVCA